MSRRIRVAAKAKPTQYGPGSFGCHEAMHMAMVLAEMTTDRLVEHPAIQANPKWLALAEEADAALYALYQLIGQEHMP